MAANFCVHLGTSVLAPEASPVFFLRSHFGLFQVFLLMSLLKLFKIDNDFAELIHGSTILESQQLMLLGILKLSYH
jgi:hypothetical protein